MKPLDACDHAPQVLVGLGMWAALACVLIFLFGCGSALSTATSGVNNGRALLEVAHDTITESCVPAYNRAATSADLARVDAVCLPAKSAYEAARAAWIAAVAAVLAAQAGGDATAVAAVMPRFVAAAAVLAKALGKVSP